MALAASGIKSPEINVTPLIDVLLVLLIICMIITPVDPKGFDALVPVPAQNHTAAPEDPIVLQLTKAADEEAQPQLAINHQQIGWNDLESRLSSVYQQRSNHVLFLQGDRAISFRYVAEVMDEAHKAGVEHIGLLNDKVPIS